MFGLTRKQIVALALAGSQSQLRNRGGADITITRPTLLSECGGRWEDADRNYIAALGWVWCTHATHPNEDDAHFFPFEYQETRGKFQPVELHPVAAYTYTEVEGNTVHFYTCKNMELLPQAWFVRVGHYKVVVEFHTDAEDSKASIWVGEVNYVTNISHDGETCAIVKSPERDFSEIADHFIAIAREIRKAHEQK